MAPNGTDAVAVVARIRRTARPDAANDDVISSSTRDLPPPSGALTSTTLALFRAVDNNAPTTVATMCDRPTHGRDPVRGAPVTPAADAVLMPPSMHRPVSLQIAGWAVRLRQAMSSQRSSANVVINRYSRLVGRRFVFEHDTTDTVSPLIRLAACRMSLEYLLVMDSATLRYV